MPLGPFADVLRDVLDGVNVFPRGTETIDGTVVCRALGSSGGVAAEVSAERGNVSQWRDNRSRQNKVSN